MLSLSGSLLHVKQSVELFASRFSLDPITGDGNKET